MQRAYGERDLPVGTIIMAPWHRPALDPNPNHPDRTQTKHGAVISKCRPLIVIGHSVDHADCMAMYTHSGCGITKLRRKQKAEYMQVRAQPANDTENKDNILTVSRDHDEWEVFDRGDSYVKTTEIGSHYFAVKCKLMGRLDNKSTIHLLERWGGRGCGRISADINKLKGWHTRRNQIHDWVVFTAVALKYGKKAAALDELDDASGKAVGQGTPRANEEGKAQGPTTQEQPLYALRGPPIG